MNIVQITPGAGGMFCGNCFRDNALVASLRGLGHPTLMVPLYLPLRLDEADQSADTPIFFSGINVYLEQQSALLRRMPAWLHRVLASRRLLQFAAGRAAQTRASDVGELMLSMLRGEHGHQVRELDELVAWLQTQPRPDVLCLSNALLLGLARTLRRQLHVPVVCMLQGEDSFLDALPDAHREAAWQLLRERAADVDLFIAPSHYFAARMSERLQLRPQQLRVVPHGISLTGYAEVRGPKVEARNPVLGYFARMCHDKGLDLLVDAFIALRQRGRVPGLRLKVGGGCGPGDEPFVQAQQAKLAAAGVGDAVEFIKNPDRAGKLALLHSLDVFSVPAHYGEAFGLYVVEALAAGVPVVQPRTAAFPELIEATGGGVLCEPGSAPALAEAIEALLLDAPRAGRLAAAGHKAVHECYSDVGMARGILRAYWDVAGSAVFPAAPAAA